MHVIISGYNHHYQQQQQQQPAILATLPTADYMTMQPAAAAYMASSYPANQSRFTLTMILSSL